MYQKIFFSSRLWIGILLGILLIPAIIYSKFLFCLEMNLLLIISYFEWKNMFFANKNRGEHENRGEHKNFNEHDNFNKHDNLNLHKNPNDHNNFSNLNKNSNEFDEVSEINEMRQKNNRKWTFYQKLFFAVIMPSFLSLIFVRIFFSYQYTLMYFIHIWLVDVLALIFGKIIGGPKLLTKISPNKTISGFFFGILLAAILATLIDRIIFQALSIKNLFFYYCLMGFLAQGGDLTLSYFKRQFGIKDFILFKKPLLLSHGGILDRFDSLLFTGPTYAIILIVLQIIS